MTIIQDTLQFEDFQVTSNYSKSEIGKILHKIEKNAQTSFLHQPSDS